MGVAGFDKKVVENKIHEQMKEEAERAYDDELYDSVDDAMDGIAYYGISKFTVKDLVSDRQLPEAVQDLRDNGYFYPEMP